MQMKKIALTSLDKKQMRLTTKGEHVTILRNIERIQAQGIASMETKSNISLLKEFEEALDHVVKALRIPDEYRPILSQSLSSKEDKKALIAFAACPQISYGKMPFPMKEALTKHSRCLKSLAELDLERRMQGGGTGNNQQQETLPFTLQEPPFISVLYPRKPFLRTAFYRFAMHTGPGGKNPDV